MRMSLGKGGWARVEEIDLPGPLYVRFRDVEGRLRVSEVYLDASQGSDFIDPSDLRGIPLGMIEAIANKDGDYVRHGLSIPAPDLSTLASYYATGFGQPEKREGDWVVLSFMSQYVDELRESLPYPVKRVPHARSGRTNPRAFRGNTTYRLTSTPDEGLTDDFLRQLARAYAAAVERGERPNKAIAEQVAETIGAESFPVKTVQRWVYTARQRGIMPPGSKGRAG